MNIRHLVSARPGKAQSCAVIDRRRSGSRRALLVIPFVFSLALTACVSPSPDLAPLSATTKSKSGTSSSPSASSDAASSANGSAAQALNSLPVKGRAPKTGYDRDSFGSAWADVDRNGCDTRNDILARDLVERQMQDSCIVLSGVLYPDPYTAGNITFVRGKSLVDIDHVVALGNAWVTGAFQWDSEKKQQFANDPLNLLAVSASANRQKSDADAATWLPSNSAYRCAYVSRQIAVKAKYSLWVTSSEKAMMAKVLTACPDATLPDNATLPMPVPTSPGQGGATTPPPAAGQPQRYRSCDEARKAGVTPIRKNGNRAIYDMNQHLDRDKDGVACE